MVNTIVEKNFTPTSAMKPPSQREEIEAALARAGYQPERPGFEKLAHEIGLGWETIYKAWLGSSSLGKAALRQIQNVGWSPAADSLSDSALPTIADAKAAIDYIFTHADKEKISMLAGMLEAARQSVALKAKIPPTVAGSVPDHVVIRYTEESPAPPKKARKSPRK